MNMVGELIKNGENAASGTLNKEPFTAAKKVQERSRYSDSRTPSIIYRCCKELGVRVFFARLLAENLIVVATLGSVLLAVATDMLNASMMLLTTATLPYTKARDKRNHKKQQNQKRYVTILFHLSIVLHRQR